MALLWQAAIFLQCILLINCAPPERVLSDFNEYYSAQIRPILDYLNADVNRQYNYKFGYLLDAQKKTDDVTELQIEVEAESIDQNAYYTFLLVCKGYVEYFEYEYRALPGVNCYNKYPEQIISTDEYTTETTTADQQQPEITEEQLTEIRKYCLGCAMEVNKNAEGVENLVNTALQHIESERDSKHVALDVVKIERQVVSGIKFTIILEVAPTLCPKNTYIENLNACPIDNHISPQFCMIKFIQKPWLGDEKHIISNNCTVSQEFVPKKARNDFDNEIDVNNDYVKGKDSNNMDVNGPNFDKMAEEGNLDVMPMDPLRLLDLESQIIPDDKHKVEATKSALETAQLGVEDIPSVQTSTDSMFEANEHFTEEQKMMQDESHESNNVRKRNSEESNESDSEKAGSTVQAEERIKRETKSSEESSEEEKKPAPTTDGATVAKRSAQSSEESSEEKKQVNEDQPTINKREIVSSEESKESDENHSETPNDPARRKRAADDDSSSSSSSEEDNNGDNKKKDNKDDDDDDDDDKDKVTKKHKKYVSKKEDIKKKDKQDDDNDDNDDDDKDDKHKNKDKDDKKDKDDNNNNNDDSSSSSSSEEDDKKRNKRSASSSSSSSSSDDDDDDDDNNNNNNHHQEKPRKNKKYQSKTKQNRHDDDDDDDDDNNGKDKNGDDSSSSSSSSSDDDDDDDNGNNNNKNRKRHRRNVIQSPDKTKIIELADYVAASLDTADVKNTVKDIVKVRKTDLEGSVYHLWLKLEEKQCSFTDCATTGEKLCKSQVYVSPTNNIKILKSACDLDTRTKRQIPGAPTNADNNDERIKSLTKTTLLKLDAESTHDNKYKIVQILNAQKQVVSGILYKIKAEIILSDCAKTSDVDSELCGELKEAKKKICDLKIWEQAWLKKLDTEVKCDDNTQHHFRQRRSTNHLLGQDDHDIHFGLFKSFMASYNKQYKNKEEMLFRFKVFRENMKMAKVLNDNEQGTAHYGATQFADLTKDEFKKMYLGYRPDLASENNVPFAQADIPNIELPTEFDWRDKGAVTEVKNQGQCGSCWAFSVTGNVEGQYSIHHGKLLEFSEQELVDCDKMDDGCNGGLMDNAYRAIEKMGGLELETDYPYEAEDERCTFNPTKARVQLSGALNISQDETDMAKWLTKNGPISIAINANAMQLYMGGVSHPWKFLCSPKNLDHGVLIVGYGVHNYPKFKKSLPYWIVKNSWGKSWGEQGYYRVYKGDGTCGVNQTPSSAIVA